MAERIRYTLQNDFALLRDPLYLRNNAFKFLGAGETPISGSRGKKQPIKEELELQILEVRMKIYQPLVVIQYIDRTTFYFWSWEPRDFRITRYQVLLVLQAQSSVVSRFPQFQISNEM